MLLVDHLASAFLNKLIQREEESRRRQSATAGESTALPSVPPWESWELDKNFLKVLSRWTLDHPESTLEQVLQKISLGLDSGKDLFSLIPDSPFPARGLVTALAHLFKLGVAVSRARRDVHDFVKDIVRWVDQVKAAFQFAKGGRFTRSAWRDLRSMRDLIEEVCLWAVARLEDRRWMRVGHGLMIQKEITDFQARITEARGLFQDLAVINLASGLDSIKRDLRTLLGDQHVVLAEIKKIRESQEQQLTRIVNEIEMQKQAAARERFFAETLATRSVANPTYDRQGKRPCDPDTRVEVLDEIWTWANDVSSVSQNFLWLTGDPGCGKSAITASLARDCKDKDILWAQFFINRNNVETTDPNSYFPSIARQLANRSPDVSQAIYDTLKGKRSLMDSISADQAAKLFVDAIRVASQLDTEQPVVVVIDGLDETDRGRLTDTATIFSTLFTALTSHHNVKVFISSRTEDEIRNPFAHSFHVNHVKHIHLDTSAPSSIRDVSTFILRNLMKIVAKNDLNWEIWPGQVRAEALGIRASGLFIWAVTAIKFVQEQIDSNGLECLSDLLDMLTADALGDINALYELILRVTLRDSAPEWEFERFRRIIGAIVFIQEPLCLDDLTVLLNLRKTRDSDPVDMPHFVRRLRTVLVAGTDAIDGSTVPRLHKSFFEFITSMRVDPHFRVDTEDANVELAVQCLHLLSYAHNAIIDHTLSAAFRYAYRFWSTHLLCTRAKNSGLVILDKPEISTAAKLGLFIKQYVRTMTSPLKLEFMQGKSQIKLTTENGDRVWDMASGRDVINWHAESVSSLAFSPDGKEVVSCSTDASIRFWNTSTGQCHNTIHYGSPLLTVAFSPDGKYIAAGSSDHILCLWDAGTGLSVHSPLRGHTGPVTCTAFSSDGRWLISGSVDKTCRLWDVQTGQSVGGPFVGHSSRISSVTFDTETPGATYFQSGADDGTIKSWGISARDQVGEVRVHEKRVNSLAFSRASGTKLLVSASNDGTVRHWDTKAPNQEPIGWPMRAHERAGLRVAVSSNGRHVFSGSRDAICVATIGNHECVTQAYNYKAFTKMRHDVDSDRITALAFSPDVRYFACAGFVVCVYELRFTEENLRLEITPVKIPPLGNDRTLLRPPANGSTSHLPDFNDKLGAVLLNVEEDGWTYNAEAKNSRLEELRWFESRARNETQGSTVMWAFVDNRVVRADVRDGVVAVWRREDSNGYPLQ